MSMFRKAERKKAKLRLGISGPAGSGKTYSALLIAKGIGGKIALVDTEHGSGELYAHLVNYDVAILKPPFTPIRYIQLMKEAEAAGYEIIILDSISHAWAGEDGLLDMQSKVAKSSGNSYTAWREITPLHNQFVEAILQSPGHIIATMRSKVDYVLELNDRGKQVPRKIGLAPIQREGMDYEFTTVFDLIQDSHLATVSKDRTSLFDGCPFTPTVETGKLLLDWLNRGIEAPEPVKTTSNFELQIEKMQGAINPDLFDSLCEPYRPLNLLVKAKQVELYKLLKNNVSL